MRVGVISDTHDNVRNVRKAFRFLENEVKTVVHLGDIISPFILRFIREEYSGMLYGVFGNNDGDKLFLEYHIRKYGWKFKPIPHSVEFNGRLFFIMHEPVDPDSLLAGGRYSGVLYGHTHERVYKRDGSRIILNPGEACGYLSGEPTFALLDVDSLEVEWINIDKLEE